ncbi:MAG: restriction endonuclease subunit S [Verrucomicrobiota bacterium]
MKTERLGGLATFLSGFAFKSNLFNDEEKGMPIIRIRDVIRGRSETYFSGEYDERYLVKKGDYLIGMDGEFNLARWDSEPALLNQRVCKIDSLSRTIDRGYLGRFLPAALKKIEDATPFVTVKHLSVKTLNEIEIPLPPLAEQKRIAAILDAADALRAKRREALAQLDALLQSTFLTLFGDPVENPMGWVNDSLTNHGSFKNGLNYGKSEKGIEVTCLGVGNFGSRSRIDDVSKLPSLSLNSMPPKEYLLKEGDIVFVRSNGNRALVGRCLSIHPNDNPVTFGGFCIRYRIEDSQLVATYLTHLFRTASMRSCMLQGGQGANIQNINQKVLGDLTIPLPPLTLQRRFAAIVESIERQKAAQRAHLTELAALFAALQHRAFRGEL